MKHFIILLLALSFTSSCKKDPTKKAFLYGRLLDNCNGSPVPNQELYFYKNFQAGGASIFSLDKEQELLETTTTDEDGYFYFSGEDYTNKSRNHFDNSSIRIPSTNVKIADGSMGKNFKAEGSEYSHQNVGDLILNGMKTDLTLKIASNNNAVYYDSVQVSGFESYVMLKDPVDGWFNTTLNQEIIPTKYFTTTNDPNDEKHRFYLSLFFYKDGDFSVKWAEAYYFDQCISSGNIVFDF